MASTPREIGTLIVVILKARNLPNKRHIGKQDPYCAVEFNRDKRRTKAVRRGGQHPEWDEEIRFTVFEDVEDELARTGDRDGTPPPPPPKKAIERPIKGGKLMWMACYADDQREPDLIGEATVDLTEVLTKGETDEWFTLLSKDKYCGEVYLELTFWSNDAPPEKKPTPQASNKNPNYGGPGSFTPTQEHRQQRVGSQSYNSGHGQTASPTTGPKKPALPSSLTPSGSLANIDLYIPPYERPDTYNTNDISQLSQGMDGLAIRGSRRRESHPPLNGEAIRPSSTYQHIPQPAEYDDFHPSSSFNSFRSFRGYESLTPRPESTASQYYSPEFPPSQEILPGISANSDRRPVATDKYEHSPQYYDYGQSYNTAPYSADRFPPQFSYGDDFPTAPFQQPLYSSHSDGPSTFPTQPTLFSDYPAPPPPPASAPPLNLFQPPPLPQAGHTTSSGVNYPRYEQPPTSFAGGSSTYLQYNSPGVRPLPTPAPHHVPSHIQPDDTSSRLEHHHILPPETRPQSVFSPPPPPPPPPSGLTSGGPPPRTSFDYANIPLPPPVNLPPTRSHLPYPPPPPPPLPGVRDY